MILLDVPADTADATRERLEQFIFTENVQVESLAATMTSVWIHGPKAHSVLERVIGPSERTGPTGLAGWRDYQHAQVEFHQQPVSVARIDQLGVPGFCVFVERGREQELIAALTGAGAHVVAADAIEAARVEAGYPLFGVDMTDDTIPLEAGIEDRAISLTKGCYVGQEVIIRVLHRGHGRVARKLVGLRIDGPVPPRGARLFAADRDIGFVTSAAASPRLGSIAMGYAHRDFINPGTAIDVATGAGRAPATINERLILPGA
jgi:folate-binding protein YgfZ